MIFTLVQKEFSKFKYYNTVSAYKMNESGGMDLLKSLSIMAKEYIYPSLKTISNLIGQYIHQIRIVFK
jgi:hypothetical protein